MNNYSIEFYVEWVENFISKFKYCHVKCNHFELRSVPGLFQGDDAADDDDVDDGCWWASVEMVISSKNILVSFLEFDKNYDEKNSSLIDELVNEWKWKETKNDRARKKFACQTELLLLILLKKKVNNNYDYNRMLIIIFILEKNT